MFFSKIIQFFDNYYKQVNFLYKLLSFLLLFFYLGYHALSGKNGYNSYIVVKKELTERQEILNKIKTDFEDLKLKVDHLSSNSLDLDLLEERCRIVLNYGYPEETIIRTSTISNTNK